MQLGLRSDGPCHLYSRTEPLRQYRRTAWKKARLPQRGKADARHLTVVSKNRIERSRPSVSAAMALAAKGMEHGNKRTRI